MKIRIILLILFICISKLYSQSNDCGFILCETHKYYPKDMIPFLSKEDYQPTSNNYYIINTVTKDTVFKSIIDKNQIDISIKIFAEELYEFKQIKNGKNKDLIISKYIINCDSVSLVNTITISNDSFEEISINNCRYGWFTVVFNHLADGATKPPDYDFFDMGTYSRLINISGFDMKIVSDDIVRIKK
jgi:hypothetical protein